MYVYLYKKKEEKEFHYFSPSSSPFSIVMDNSLNNEFFLIVLKFFQNNISNSFDSIRLIKY